MAPIIEPNDDAPVGRVLSRREVLSLLAGFGGMAVLAACDTGLPGTPQPTNTGTAGTTTQTVPAQAVATPNGTALNAEAATAVAATPAPSSPTAEAAALPDCVVKPEMTEGPYFVDVDLNRSDIRSNTSDGAMSAGVPLALAFVVSQVGSSACTPLGGAQVDIWHCDADGVYSGVQGSSGTNFLRGYQVTDASGKANFTSIYPGWYSGRAVHIHFKIRTKGADGGDYEFTSQLFFDENVNNAVYAQAPYSSKGQADVPNARDSIYRSGGDQLLLTPTESNGGYTATFNIALDLSDAAAGADDGAGGGPGGPRP
ncbi:MAG: intradiol ring-cleavage dioxygenase [Chloroflexota bacterium]|nr:intradiol ring-cleavage dioxygenase [Chloroflexota bacterium]